MQHFHWYSAIKHPPLPAASAYQLNNPICHFNSGSRSKWAEKRKKMYSSCCPTSSSYDNHDVTQKKKGNTNRSIRVTDKTARVVWDWQLRPMRTLEGVFKSSTPKKTKPLGQYTNQFLPLKLFNCVVANSEQMVAGSRTITLFKRSLPKTPPLLQTMGFYTSN